MLKLSPSSLPLSSLIILFFSRSLSLFFFVSSYSFGMINLRLRYAPRLKRSFKILVISLYSLLPRSFTLSSVVSLPTYAGKRRAEKCTILEIFMKLRHIALESYEYLKFSNYILVTNRTTRRFLNVINMLIIPSLSIDINFDSHTRRIFN